MPTIKISSVVDERAWEELKAVAAESHQNISGLLSEAIADCVRRRRIRPAVMENRTGTGPNRNRGQDRTGTGVTSSIFGRRASD